MTGGRDQWYRDIIVGDSGGPAMMPINGELAMVVTWTVAGSGPNYHNRDWSSIIGTLDALAGISTGYTPSVIDLTSFPTYS
jgi:hypothetical protein